MKQLVLKIIVLLLINNSHSCGMSPATNPNEAFIHSPFPKELFISVGACDDHPRDRLRSVCRFLSDVLSIKKGPALKSLINHPLFYTNPKTLQYLAFNAGWDQDSDTLKSLMRNMSQQDYEYAYKVIDNKYSHFGLVDIVITRMPHHYGDIKNSAEMYGCTFLCSDLDFIYSDTNCLSNKRWGLELNELKMACYNKDVQKYKELLNKAEGDQTSLCMMAIDKNNSECVSACLSRPNFFPRSLFDPKLYYDLSIVAIENKKHVSFEAIVQHYFCAEKLNTARDSGQKKEFSISWWLLEAMYPSDDKKPCSFIDWAIEKYILPPNHEGEYISLIDSLIKYIHDNNLPDEKIYIDILKKHTTLQLGYR